MMDVNARRFRCIPEWVTAAGATISQALAEPRDDVTIRRWLLIDIEEADIVHTCATLVECRAKRDELQRAL